jgi:hypothetical protein
MSGEHSQVSTRYSYNGSTIFDGTNTHDRSIIGNAEFWFDPSSDQFSNWPIDDAPENEHAPVSIADMIPDLSAPTAGLAAADTTFDHGASSFFATWYHDSSTWSYDSVSTGDYFKPLSDLSRHQSLNLSFDDAQETGPAPGSVFDVFGSSHVSIVGLTNSAGPTFDHGNAFSGAAPGGEDDITLIDDVSFAKGGHGGGGGSGGGGGGGGGGGIVTQYFSGSANGTDGFDIWIEFKGSGWTTDLQKAFENAADYFTTVITDDIGGGGIFRGKTIDDLYVTAELKAIDGTGGILGQAGPSAVWTSNDLTAVGQMQFDVADATDYFGRGLWDDIVTHEMMHVLGFGSLWDYGSHSLVSGTEYTGASGLAAYQAAVDSSATYIPVEDGGGSGTAGSHWHEQALTNELMTGYINDDHNASTITDNYLSKFSVMSLADLGYKVAYQDYTYDGTPIV